MGNSNVDIVEDVHVEPRYSEEEEAVIPLYRERMQDLHSSGPPLVLAERRNGQREEPL